MIDHIKLVWKSLTGEKNTVKAIWKLIYTAVGYISAFFSFAVLLEDLAGWDKLKVWSKDHWWVLIVLGVILSLVHNRKRINCCRQVEGADLQIAVSVKDIFCNREANSFVIPTNTFFRTKMEDEYISPRSVQGRFQLKYFKKDFAPLDKLIEKNLKEQGIQGKDATDRFGTVKQYPVGTVAKVEHRDKHYYFVALNDVNEFGKPINQTMANVDDALDAVIKGIMTIGNCDVLCMPLIGSGRAAIQEATKEAVFKKTVDRFIDSDKKISSKLIIAISPKDYLEGKINLDKAKKYLEYKCEFR